MRKTGYIAGIARGHNAGVCLLKDGEIVFAIEEERLSRYKYDGGPLASMIKILDYTDKIDYLAISHTQDADEPLNDYVRQDVYTALARKLRLIEDPETQVVKYHAQHHRSHAALAFYRSGFEKASAIIVDGAGTFVERPDGQTMFEVESIYDCAYPATFTEIYKHFGGNGPWRTEHYNADGSATEVMINDKAGIVKAYEAVTRFCGFDSIEAGKTMGLFPYGEPNKAPKIYTNAFGGNKDLFTCTYPNGAWVDESEFPEIRDRIYDPSDIIRSAKDPDNQDEQDRIQELLRKSDREDVTLLPSRRNMAYNVQVESQQLVLDLILKSIERTGNKNIVISGGYALNCVANYFFLKHLPEGVKIYVEPVSNDAGTAMGAAFYHYYLTSQDNKLRTKDENLFLGPVQNITEDIIRETAKKYNGNVTTDVDYKQVIDTIRNKNIVALYQERGESGPRALGNRSLMYDPTDPNGKDFVNLVKKREYFRPFAATVLQDDVHEWFDLRGMEDSPSMMYAVNCQPGVKEKIPAVIHVDDTCRIQTVTKEQNEHWYNLIKEFKNQTGVPALFNTSFNLGGEPLVETIDDAMRTLYNSGINYIYFPATKMLVNIEHNERR
jgi:carbamoyltransferase|tara:strand:+ start:1596 stop:3422 length:1827 start_codon:yes stop_codon:yes gene_type:complete